MTTLIPLEDEGEWGVSGPSVATRETEESQNPRPLDETGYQQMKAGLEPWDPLRILQFFGLTESVQEDEK